MPTATPAQIVLVSAYIVTGSTKCAAACLGMSHSAYRHRLARVYARFDVTTMGQLVYVIREQLPVESGTTDPLSIR